MVTVKSTRILVNGNLGDEMKVCMISAGVPVNIGGVESFVNELSNILASHGVNVTVIGRSDRDFVQKGKNKRIIGIRLNYYLPEVLHFPHYADYVFQFNIWKKIPREHFDIIHGGNDNALLLLPGRKAPLVVTFHGTLAGAFKRFKHVSRLRPYQYFLSTYPEKIIAQRCDISIACSYAVKNELTMFYGVNRNRVKVIHNGVNAAKFRVLNKATVKKKLRLPLKNKYGIWVGTDVRRKGLVTAIDAIRNLDGVKLIVVGVNGKSDEKIVYFGRVSEFKKILLYNSADFFIFPTFYEGFPLAPLEALACGLPIIISEECPTKEIIHEGVHGFVVNERKPECYADKIEVLLNDNKRYQEMSYNCRKLAEKFSWENQGKEYLKIYEKLVQ